MQANKPHISTGLRHIFAIVSSQIFTMIEPVNRRLEISPRDISFLCSLSIIHAYMCCPRLCSHAGWLLLKWSAIGIGFNGAETNCGIARILGILLMNSWDT